MPNPNSLSGSWNEQKVFASDGEPQAWFGSWVSISDKTAFISAKNATIGGRASQGAVYVLNKVGSTWQQVQKLVASDGAVGDQFGSCIAVSGKTAFFTAPYATIEGRVWQGAVYIFTLEADGWKQKRKLATKQPTAFANFGTAVAVNAKYAFIGSGGASQAGVYKPRRLHIFKLVASRTGDTWVESQIIDSPRPEDATSSFAASMAVSESAAFIGARSTTLGANIGQGEVHVYNVSDGQWSRTAKLTSSDGAARDNFGVSIAINDGTALIGSPGAATNGQTSQGAVYRFERSGSYWTQTQKLLAIDGTAFNLFGASVSLSKDSALVGAYAADNYRGAAYVFEKSDSVWAQTKKLVASQGQSGDVFGYYAALDGSTALVGSYGARISGSVKQGAAYFYTRSSSVQPSSLP